MRNPLVAAYAILTLEGDSGLFGAHFAEDEKWTRRGFLMEARAFTMCIATHWSCKTPYRKCEVIGPDRELCPPGRTAGSIA